MAKKEESLDIDMMAQMEAKFAKMLEEANKKVEEAEKRAEAIIAAAEKTKGNTELPEHIKKMNEYNEERITIKLFKDGDKYNDDLFVSVNGQAFNIPRGVPVNIPRKIAATLEQSDLQDVKTAQYMDAKENEFVAESKRRDF